MVPVDSAPPAPVRVLPKAITCSSSYKWPPNIADLLEHAVDRVPDRTALICGEHQVSYAELEERANRPAHHLRQHGVTQGSHVGVYCQNSIEAVQAMIAAYKLRAVAININYRYLDNELRYLFENARSGRSGSRPALHRPGCPGAA